MCRHSPNLREGHMASRHLRSPPVHVVDYDRCSTAAHILDRLVPTDIAADWLVAFQLGISSDFSVHGDTSYRRRLGTRHGSKLRVKHPLAPVRNVRTRMTIAFRNVHVAQGLLSGCWYLPTTPTMWLPCRSIQTLPDHRLSCVPPSHTCVQMVVRWMSSKSVPSSPSCPRSQGAWSYLVTKTGHKSRQHPARYVPRVQK